MSKTKSRPRHGRTRVGLAIGAAALVAVGTAQAPAYAAIAPATATPSAGPELQDTPIQVSSTTAFLAGVSNPHVTFSIPACQTTYNTTAQTATPTPNSGITTSVGNVIGGAARKQSDTRLAVTVPADVQTNAVNNALQKWNVCVYASNATNAEQIAVASYSVGAPAGLLGVTPRSGPATGGNTVTITGSSLPTTVGTTGIISASVDGMPITGLKSISSSAFSGVMPAHSPGRNLTVAVTTNVGTVYLKNGYNYENGASVTPNTSPSSAGIVDISVTGSNFLTPTFTAGATTLAASGHVFLVAGEYNPGDTLTVDTYRDNPPVAECTDVLVFSNSELICRLQLWQRLTATTGVIGAATTRSITNATTGTGTTNLVSTTANFTSADVGRLVSDAGDVNITAGTYIVSVTSPTTAVMSAVGKAASSSATVVIGGDRLAVNTTTATATTITAPAATFFQRDVGRRIAVAGATASTGTVITAVNNDGTVATLSRALGSPGSITSVQVLGESVVPDGAYVVTVVNSGALSANADTVNYQQSVVSSDSTFTVANY
jgi:hypothetical protein